jgi:polyadenylate-binding protein
VQRYLKSDQRGTSKKLFNNLFVKQFPRPDFTDEDLKKLFEPYGEIISAIVMRNQGGFSLGFGFVCFKYPESAERAMADFQSSV